MHLFTTHGPEITVAFISRLLLGILFFFQGYDSIFRLKLSAVIDAIGPAMLEKGLPKIYIRLGAYFTSYANLICGSLLIIGFAKYYACYLLAVDMLFTAFAFSVIKPMWDMQYFFPRFVLLIFCLITPSQWDITSVDYLWSLIKFLKSL